METTFTDILFSPVNIGLTIFVIILIVYWIFSMISGVDSNLDFDFDADLDIDMDVDLDSDVSLSNQAESANMDFENISNVELNKEDVVPNRRKPLKWWQIFLIYFNFVGLPFMFTLTAFIFSWWLITGVATSVTNTYNNGVGVIIMLIAIIPALILTKIVTTPFKSIFKNLNRDGDAPIDFIGRKGVSQSNLKESKMGNAEVLVEGSPMSIYIKSLDGSPIQYKDEILIIKEAEDKSFYFVKLYNN